jgi:hypothetical protein
MSDASIAIDKLRHIEDLWENLKRTKTGTPEYAALIKEIAALSTEYQGLVEGTKNLE